MRRGFSELFVRFLLLALLAAIPLWSQPDSLILDYAGFEKAVLEKYPILLEKELSIQEKEIALRKIEVGAWLPRFELDFGVGPAPGLLPRTDSNFVLDGGQVDSSRWVEASDPSFNFKKWGPFFGMELGVVQPLNVHRYRAGKKAATLDLEVTRHKFYKEEMKVSREVQEIYYGMLLAGRMLKELEQAERDFAKAEEKIEEMLDEEAEAVSQKDLLKIRASKYELVKHKNEALVGLERARMAARFYLFLGDSLNFTPADTVLTKVTLPVPPMDSLQRWLVQEHPDLKRLNGGLEARREMLKVALGEMGPDIFLFGSFKYAKAWSPEREFGEDNVFAQDPLNQIVAVGGLGLRLRLNIWSRYQKYRKEKLELKKLERTEVYAARGLLVRLEEARLKIMEASKNLEAAETSLRAAEAWLKGAAMDYDLDPSQAPQMISPYKTALTARGDFFKAVYDYNLALGGLAHAVGWTLSDYLSKVTPGS